MIAFLLSASSGNTNGIARTDHAENAITRSVTARRMTPRNRRLVMDSMERSRSQRFMSIQPMAAISYSYSPANPFPIWLPCQANGTTPYHRYISNLESFSSSTKMRASEDGKSSLIAPKGILFILDRRQVTEDSSHGMIASRRFEWSHDKSELERIRHITLSVCYLRGFENHVIRSFSNPNEARPSIDRRR